MNGFRSKAHDTAFYYAYRENGYIVMPGGSEFISSRRERVVAVRRIEEVPYTYAWSGEGEMKSELFPSTFVMSDLPRIAGQKRERKSIKFDAALEKGKMTEYTILLHCTQTGKAPEPFLSSRSPHRVDELLMRVVFPANLLPENVVYLKRNADGIEVHREAI